MTHSVRLATPRDIPAIQGVYRRSWRAAYEPFLDKDVLSRLGAQRAKDFDWARGMRAPDAMVLVGADRDGQVIGVAQVNEVLGSPRDLPEVTMLYVDPSVWGSGVASSLLTACVTWISKQGHAAARLRVVENHHRARRFYEREGWTLDPALDPVITDLATLLYYRRDVAVT